MRKVKLGLVGVGVPSAEPTWKARLHWFVPSIAWARYFPKIASLNNAELVAVCDIVEEYAKKAQQVYNVKQTFKDYDEMLEKADIDAVIITTPNRFHAPMAIKAIKAGKHVLVEKPLATNLDDAKKVLEEASKANVKVLALPWIYTKFFLKVKEIIDKKEIGQIAIVRSRYSHGGPGHSEWFFKAEEGGGVIFDLGIYPISTITGWFGPVKSVQALSTTVVKQRIIKDKPMNIEVEDNAIISLTLENDTLASIETNYCTVSHVGMMHELHGTEGTIFLENGDIDLRFFSKKKLLNGLEGWISLKDAERAQKVWAVADPIVEYFIESILENRDITFFVKHQVHVIEILEKSKISAQTGKRISLTTTFEPSKEIKVEY
ncbi:MAG: Gfo/Idh/MocA family oxidoreductase [Nitrososphaeria archaeon]|nr:Gfo/Idh/MocA family oxidoreductase [Nitrososphaeria archaeon]